MSILITALNAALNTTLNLLTLALYPEFRLASDPVLDLMDRYDIEGDA